MIDKENLLKKLAPLGETAEWSEIMSALEPSEREYLIGLINDDEFLRFMVREGL